jgi:hypothetical protein
MKYSFFLLLAVIFLNGCTPEKEKTVSETGETANQEEAVAETPEPNEEYRISREQAGFVKVNMKVEQLDSIFKKGEVNKSTYKSEGQTYEAYFVTRNDKKEPSLRLETICNNNDCKIWRIKILDPEYRTGTGLGIGSKAGDIKKYHYIDWISSSAEPVIRLERLGLSFVLDKKTLPPAIVNSLVKENLPDSAKVESIYITESGIK